MAARADDPMSLVSIGVFYLNGTGLPKDVATGMVYLTRAAMCGSEHACLCLANHYATGTVVRFLNKEQATYWYKRSLRSGVKDSVQLPRERREAWLNEHDRVP